MDDFVTVNGIYAKFFGNHKPARSAVQVARLPLNALFEIESVVRYVISRRKATALRSLNFSLQPCLIDDKLRQEYKLGM